MNKPLNCVVCNKQFRPIKYGVAKYCSSKCSKIAKKRVYINKLRKECAICGIKEKLEIHHIDENKDNNLDSNLIILCLEHHKFITSYNRKLELLRKLEKDIKNKKH